VHVRGTFRIAAGATGVTRQSMSLSTLPGSPPLHDIPAVWRAAHQYAQAQQKLTAIPVFEPDPGFALILFDDLGATNWVKPQPVALSATYEQPTFAEPGSVIRNVGRVTGKPTICTFVPDTGNAQGVKNTYDCHVLDALNQYLFWHDVPTSTYIAQL
jgi:hypothetical protein